MKTTRLTWVIVLCMAALLLTSCLRAPAAPAKPAEPAEPARPAQPADPAKPADPKEPTDPSGDGSEVWINASDSIDLNGMNLYWQQDYLQFAGDENAKLSMYVRAEMDENGLLLFDDGQDWLLLLETSLGNYPLFPRKYVQLGGVSCAVFIDAGNSFHVLVTEQQTAGYLIYDCVYDQDRQAFKQKTIYKAEGINFITAGYRQ